MANKQYGLIIPKKSKQATLKKPSVFENDSEEEKEENDKSQSAETKVDSWKSKIKKKSQLVIQKVIEEDPTVYEYDSIYDDMQKEKEVKKAVETEPKDKKPKYINSLLKAAESRKKEYERRIERAIQKEREQEGDQYKDKEAFVTSSYKKKMLEMQEQEEKERRERELEEKNDVMKQKDLSGFYRHLLKQTTGEVAAATDASAGRQNLSENANNARDDKQSSELIRAKKAVEELKKSSSKGKRKGDTDSSDEEVHNYSSGYVTNKRKDSENKSTTDSSSDESLNPSAKKHKSRHENSHKHKKAKHKHGDSDSEQEVRHRRRHKHSKHSKSSHRDDKEKRKDKHRSHHHKEKHKRSSRRSSDSD